MIAPVSIREAVIEDTGFIVTTILEAEKIGTNRLSYSYLFDLSEGQVRGLITLILKEDVPGQEFCLSSYLIAECEGEVAGACCAWVEGAEGIASSSIKAHLFANFLGHEKFLSSKPRQDIVNQLAIPKSRGALQIESLFVVDKFRGRGIAAKLFAAQLKKNSIANTKISKIQLFLAEMNTSAVKAYSRMGFTVVQRIVSHNEELIKALPANIMILMECNPEDLR